MADPRSVTTSNILPGVHELKIAGTSVGATEGGIRYKIDTESVEQFCDQYDAPINSWRKSVRAQITVRILEFTYAKFATWVWGSTARATGGTAVGIGGRVPGSNDAQTDGVTINLHPTNVDSAILTKDINMWKAEPVSMGEVGLNKDGVPIYEVTFKGHLDMSKASAGNGLMDFGLTAAT